MYYLTFARAHKLAAFICKAFKAEAIPLIAGCLGLNNAADGSLRLTHRVKSNEIK